MVAPSGLSFFSWAASRMLSSTAAGGCVGCSTDVTGASSTKTILSLLINSWHLNKLRCSISFWTRVGIRLVQKSRFRAAFEKPPNGPNRGYFPGKVSGSWGSVKLNSFDRTIDFAVFHHKFMTKSMCCMQYNLKEKQKLPQNLLFAINFPSFPRRFTCIQSPYWLRFLLPW